ncbi:hypothetical protein BZA05DRAFT_420401 [Tricharina praecox]|uniref:uncharacterized protein n=1 Tax=Tricharina praecox TaxID=43433 RepID=UPI00221EB9FE|nr:uncharacterized protein BZA05DRAFT_420401 [Tricharina praecox]KAI5848105.1 hypothetical protein BZA05DRAFT_420401 [Tricharina praecox]
MSPQKHNYNLRKRAPRGVVVMKISVPARVEGGEWPQEMDFEEHQVEAQEEVEVRQEAEHEKKLEQQLSEQQKEKKQQKEEVKEGKKEGERQTANSSRLNCIVM